MGLASVPYFLCYAHVLDMNYSRRKSKATIHKNISDECSNDIECICNYYMDMNIASCTNSSVTHDSQCPTKQTQNKRCAEEYLRHVGRRQTLQHSVLQII